MKTSEQLRELFDEDQLQAMDAVREAMLADPKILDTHSREVRNERRPDSSS